MRRCHSQREQALMLRRWRQELADHGRWGELEKHYDRKARATKVRAAIRFEVEASR